MAKATQALSLHAEPRKTEQVRRPTEIATLAQQLELTNEVLAIIDHAQSATADPALKNRLEQLAKEAADRESCLMTAISALEPETLDDVIVLAVVTQDAFDDWSSWQEAKEVDSCTCQEGAAYRCQLKDQEKRIRRMLDAVVRGLKANGARLPPHFADRYDNSDHTLGWAGRVAELRAKVAETATAS